jgi:hypothetical protein
MEQTVQNPTCYTMAFVTPFKANRELPGDAK